MIESLFSAGSLDIRARLPASGTFAALKRSCCAGLSCSQSLPIAFAQGAVPVGPRCPGEAVHRPGKCFPTHRCRGDRRRAGCSAWRLRMPALRALRADRARLWGKTSAGRFCAASMGDLDVFLSGRDQNLCANGRSPRENIGTRSDTRRRRTSARSVFRAHSLSTRCFRRSRIAEGRIATRTISAGEPLRRDLLRNALGRSGRRSGASQRRRWRFVVSTHGKLTRGAQRSSVQCVTSGRVLTCVAVPAKWSTSNERARMRCRLQFSAAGPIKWLQPRKGPVRRADR